MSAKPTHTLGMLGLGWTWWLNRLISLHCQQLICVPVQDLATPIQSSFLSLCYESSRVQPKFLGPHGRPEEALAPWLQIGPAMATPIWGMNKWTDVISFCVSFSL